MTPPHLPVPSPPSRILFLLRFLYPASLLFAAVFNFSVPALPYFAFFLFHYHRPSYAISLATFPAIQLLVVFFYSLAALITHLVLSLLLNFRVFDASQLSLDTTLSLAIPRYNVSVWQGLRFLIPHIPIFFSSLLILLDPVPPNHRYAGSRFIFAWFRRTKRHRSRLANRRAQGGAASPTTPQIPRTKSLFPMFRYPNNGPQPTEAEPVQQARNHPSNDFGSVLTDDDLDIGSASRKRIHVVGEQPVTRFTAFMAGRGGIFWSALSTALVAVSYSSIVTFVFLAAYLTVLLSWACAIDFFNPSVNARRCLSILRVYRIYVMTYLVVIVCFQLPWLVKWFDPSENETSARILQFIGLVPINTSKPTGWAAVMAFGAAIAAYLFAGMFQASLTTVHAVREQSDAARGSSGSSSPLAPNTENERRALSSGHKVSYYEVQMLLIVMHSSSLGLLAWALVFPGILTMPLLCASLLYLGLKRVRQSKFFDYALAYALVLQLAHYIFVSVEDAWGASEEFTVRVLALQSLRPQFSVNLIESIAVALLCVNYFGRRYLDDNLHTLETNNAEDITTATALEIREFVQMSLFSSRHKKRNSLYSPFKLIIDQLALASLYVAGGLDVTAINAVFLIALSVICILQSLGLFRRPRIFAIAWCVVLIYSIAFLVTTSTACRALDGLCERRSLDDVVGVKSADRGQIVAYAATVVLASIQVNFTWTRGENDDQMDYMKDFHGKFWKFLRNYFLYAAYAALLLYPLLFLANFLSYGYVVFLFLSIVVELLLPSIRGQKAEVRRLLKKFWIFVIAFSCAAMLSRYFIRLNWFRENEDVQRWFFGLEAGDSRKFVITVGDAVVLIVMSLQGRLFVVDSLVEAAEGRNQDAGSNPVAVENAVEQSDRRDTLSDPGDNRASRENRIAFHTKHRRHKSMEEYATYEESSGSALQGMREGMSLGVPDRRNTVAANIPKDVRNSSEDSDFGGSGDSEALRRVEEEDKRRSLLELDLNRERIHQAMEVFRNFRKSVPVKQTEKFLHDIYSVGVLILRTGMMRYSYVLQAVAILAASIWLPGVSVFGAVYMFLGCLALLSAQPSFQNVTDYELPRSQSISAGMPVVLIILSFSLMSSQYIFLIAAILRESINENISSYIGLQKPADETTLPISVDAMVGHVIVFITAVVQRISVRWARMDAERLQEEEYASQLRRQMADPEQSAHALDLAVPIGQVFEGVGGLEEESRDRASQTTRILDDQYETNWMETLVWKSQSPAQLGSKDSPESDLSQMTGTTHSSDSRNGKNDDLIEQIRSGLAVIMNIFFDRLTKVLSLLNPFWRDWGFDVTFMYLIICAVSTNTVFSVLYGAVVLAFCSLQRFKIRNHWQQISLFLVGTVLAQYILTLGVPRDLNEGGEVDKWKVWALVDLGNDSDERKASLTFAFVAVIFASITLNSITNGRRGFRFWFGKIPSDDFDDTDSLSIGEGSSVRELMDLNVSTGLGSLKADKESSLEVKTSHDLGNIGDAQCPEKYFGADLSDTEPATPQFQPKISTFVSGLGQRKNHWRLGFLERDHKNSNLDSRDILLSHGNGSEASIGRKASSTSFSSGGLDFSGTSSKDIEKRFFRENDPSDFTRRPISFENMVKLVWMRFAGPLVQLFVFAVATVETNIISAVLLAVAFSFLFQFTDLSAKRKRFIFLRVYLVVAIIALVLYQAPFSTSPGIRWEGIVGLYKTESSVGLTFISLLVSLWVLCQIQGRIYESQDFQYVQRYGQEDAKVRFKRAVHEHNSRKYEKMQDRNKAERSHFARKARLTRLKALKESEKTVDAFYNVCVLHEIDFLKEQADSSRSKAASFSTYRLTENSKKKEGLPRGIQKFVRWILRGKRWALYVKQPVSSEFKSFVFRYSAWPVYIAMLLAAIVNPSITTVVYPLVVFLYLIVEQPRPPKQAWTVLMVYVCFNIAFKFVFRSPYFTFCNADIPFFGLDTANNPPSVLLFKNCAPAAGIGFDIFVLLALLGHRAVLYSRGVWDLVMSEEDMLLRSEIRGQELDTPPEMAYVEETSREAQLGGYSKKSGIKAWNDGFSVDNIWDADEQCDDVAHILTQAQRDIIGARSDSAENAKHLKSMQLPAASDSVAFGRKGELHGNDAADDAATLDKFLEEPSLRFLEGSSGGLHKNLLRSGPSNRNPPLGRSRSRGAELTFGGIPMSAQPPPAHVSKSAPPPGRRRHGMPRGPTSVQGSDASRGPSTLTRFMTLGQGFRHERLTSPVNMTHGQSRVHDALVQSRIIPQHLRRGNMLSLFNVERKGVLSMIRHYFLRLTRENDHKAVGDYYLFIFMIDFLSFVYVMFGFSAIFGDSTSGRRETWWTTNFIETRHLVTLIAMFGMIILDRICYLTRSMVGKLIIQYVSVFVYHIILFVVQDNIGVRAATQIFYVMRSIYFLLSGLQIRDGFPMYTTAQFLMRNFSTPGIVLFEIYIFVPFIWLTRTLLDWAVLPTSLEIFQYFRFIDIYMWLYRNRAVNRSRGSFRRKLGEKRRMFPRIYQGFGLFLLCVIALFLPFIIFSIFNPFFVGRELREAKVNVDLATFDNSTSGGRSYEVYQRTSVVGTSLTTTEAKAAARDIGVSLDVREREKVFEAWFSPISDTLWQPADEDRQDLIDSLVRFVNDEDAAERSPQLLFSLSATTQDRTTFGTRLEKLNLNEDNAGRIAAALENGTNLMMKVLSPLPRYSILQSGSTVFESYPGDEGEGFVCIRLIQPSPAPSFWTMSECSSSECGCSSAADLPSNGQRRHLLQIADVSAFQVGGATILTLYTAILFTIGNLLKRMFIDKRIIIPYIDMPYTLHLYQLVLDIMYARQDNQLEMEEILYNGLIDIYRDQRELVRWTGERALKLPEAWWDKSEVDNPFMVYPSFMETSTEPYLDRVVE